MINGFRSVLCVFIMPLNFRVCFFLKNTVNCLVDPEDLCFDVPLCDVKFCTF